MPTNRLLAALAALALSAGVARASPPTVLTYSGFLMDSAGTAPLTGLHDFYFRFYTLATGGTQIGTGDITVSTTVGSDGFFSVVIDVSGIANDPLFKSQMFMSVRVDADVNPMTPRVQVTSAPGALSVPYGGITGFPTAQCGAGQFATGFDVNGNLVCASAQGGVTSVAAGTGVSVSGSTGAVTVSANLATAGGDNGSSTAIARADHAHDARYVQPGALSAVGTINTPGNPVDWSQLKNVPPAIADGADAVGLTAVAVGSGLSGDGTSGAPILLPACATAGYALKWNGSAYACAADVDTNTTYAAGAGLALASGSFSIASGGVTPAMLAAAAVDTAALANGAVTAAKLAPDAVTSVAIAPEAVTSVAIANGAVTFAKLNQNGCGTGETLRWNGMTSAWECSTALGVVATTGVVTGDGSTTSPIGIQPSGITFDLWNSNGCSPDDIPKWNGFNWYCGPDRGVLSVGATLSGGLVLGGSPLAPELGLEDTGVIPGVYSMLQVDAKGRVVAAGDLPAVMLQDASLPLGAQPGNIYVSGNILTTGTFSGYLNGGAAVADSVSNNAVRPMGLNAGGQAPVAGQVPVATGTNTFSWVTPVAAGIEFANIAQTNINVRTGSATGVDFGVVAVSAPAPGYVVVRFDGYAYASTGDTLILAASNSSGTWGVNDGHTQFSGSGAPTPFSHTRVYSVGAAGTYSYYAVVCNFAGTAGTGLASVYATLTATFYPTRY